MQRESCLWEQGVLCKSFAYISTIPCTGRSLAISQCYFLLPDLTDISQASCYLLASLNNLHNQCSPPGGWNTIPSLYGLCWLQSLLLLVCFSVFLHHSWSLYAGSVLYLQYPVTKLSHIAHGCFPMPLCTKNSHHADCSPAYLLPHTSDLCWAYWYEDVLDISHPEFWFLSF